MQAIQPAVGAEAAAAVNRKVTQAAAEFEAILLNNVLGNLERTFTHVPGKKEDHSTEAYSGFAMQALASGLAQAGGIGIGKIIGKALARQTKATEWSEITLAEKDGKKP